MSGSPVAVWRPSTVTSGSYQVSRPKGWLFGRGCGGRRQEPLGLSTCLVPREMVEVLPLVSWTESLFMLGHCSIDSRLLFYLCGELKLSVASVKGYRAALNHVFSLAGVYLAANHVISPMFCGFEKSCPPHEIGPPDWNLSLVLRRFTHLPYEPIKLSSDKHLT